MARTARQVRKQKTTRGRGAKAASVQRGKVDRVGKGRRGGARRRGWRLVLWPGRHTRKLAWRLYRRAPGLLQVLVALGVVAVLALLVNLVYQVARKPTELFFPVAGALNKPPQDTWRRYAAVFEAHSTDVATAPYLAALAQVEASGNPVARTYWRWQWRPHFFQLYRPASSAVGMYQITDGTFQQARHYCIHRHQVATEGRWDDMHSCWLNGAYFRVVPSHAAELVSAYLTAQVGELVAHYPQPRDGVQRRQELATIIHLCGAGAAAHWARGGGHPRPGEHCGDQDVSQYVARVQSMTRLFQRLQELDR